MATAMIRSAHALPTDPLGRALPPRPGQHEIDLPPVAARADEPRGPIRHPGLSAVALSHLGPARERQAARQVGSGRQPSNCRHAR
jgi:hypothetical protein